MGAETKVDGGEGDANDELFVAIAGIATEILHVTPDVITRESSFKKDLSADSLDLVEVVMAVEEKYDIHFPEDEVGRIETFGQFIELAAQKIGGQAT